MTLLEETRPEEVAAEFTTMAVSTSTAVDSLNAAWLFEKRSPTSVSTVPKSKEHFQSNSSDSIVTAAMSEITQNGGDAADKNAGGPVVIKFRWAELQWDDFWSDFMVGIKSHMEGTRIRAAEHGVELFSGVTPGHPGRALIIEDYNTSGLLGSTDPETWELTKPDNFGNFVWRQGGSSKSKGAGGRHGIGKSTITELSEIRTFLAASHRNDGSGLVVYGQATFWPHNVPGSTSLYDAYGLFGEVKDGMPYPILGDAAGDLCTKIGFDRIEKNGLSIIVPYPKPDVTSDSLIRSALTKCFYQIAAGLLVIIVDDVVINSQTISEVAKRYPETAPLATIIDLAASSVTHENVESFTASETEEGKSSITAAAFSETDLERMQELWNAGETVDVRFPVPVCRKGSELQFGMGRVLMRKHDDRETIHEVAARGRVTVLHSTSHSGNYLSLFVPHDELLSTFLGDAENVAHNRWIKSNADVKYKLTKETIARVTGCFRDLYSVLTGIEQGKTIKDALTNFFWKTRQPEEIEKKHEIPAAGKEETGEPDGVGIVEKPPFDVRKVADGFVVRRSEDREGDFGIVIDVFYSSAGGKPKHNKVDFDFSDKEIIFEPTEGIVVDTAVDNHIEISSAALGSSLTVRGFDTNREITVKFKSHRNEE